MSDPPAGRARRGWREKVEPGLYRIHRVACPRSADRRAGGHCRCPFEVKAPGPAPGTTRTVTVSGTIAEARAERRGLLAKGRPPAAPESVPGTVHGFATDWFRAGAARWSPGTLALRDHAYRQRIAPRFADARLGDLTRPAVEGWAAGLLQRGDGRRAVEVAVETLRAMLAVALDAGLVAVNAAARVRLPPPAAPERTAADRVVDRRGAEPCLRRLGTSARRRSCARRLRPRCGTERLPAFAGPTCSPRSGASSSDSRSGRTRRSARLCAGPSPARSPAS